MHGNQSLDQVVLELNRNEATCSVHPLSSSSTVDLLECNTSAFVEDSLWLEAQVLIVGIGIHASSESLNISEAELSEDVLTWRVFVFSCKAAHQKKLVSLKKLAKNRSTYKITLSSTRVDFFLVPPNMWHIFSIGILTVLWLEK